MAIFGVYVLYGWSLIEHASGLTSKYKQRHTHFELLQLNSFDKQIRKCKDFYHFLIFSASMMSNQKQQTLIQSLYVMCI